MNEITISDVGHGLAASHRDNSGTIIQFDCGGSSATKAAKKGWPRSNPEVLFLSHFHTDHYNGLLELAPNSQELEKVIIPQVPRSKSSRKLLRSLLATDIRVLGERTGIIPGDLVHILKLINTQEFEIMSVHKGQTVTGGITEFDILWPPWNFTEYRGQNRGWVEDYEEAMEKDDLLRQIDSKIRDGELIEPYLSQEGMTIEPQSEPSLFIDLPQSLKGTTLPDIVKEVHETLRDKANRMSLAYHMDNRLLCLGDLNDTDIGRVVPDLVNNWDDRFSLIITPHHGTHWDDSLKEISCKWAVSSETPNRVSFENIQYSRNFQNHHLTGLDGDFNCYLSFQQGYEVPYKTLK